MDKRLNGRPVLIQKNIKLLGSKSESNRLLILQALCNNIFSIKNVSMANDTQIMLSIINNENRNVWDVQDSGTCMRFLTAYATMLNKEIIITGSKRMCQRPIKILVDALNSLGANVEFINNDGYPPLKVHPSVPVGGEINIDSSVSSQYLSSLLLIANNLEKGLVLNIDNETVSKPYVNMTIGLLESIGIKALYLDNQIVVKSFQQILPKQIYVEGDWSAAAFWYQICLLSVCSQIGLVGLLPKSLQGDRVLISLFRQLGVDSQFKEEKLILRHDPLEANPVFFESDFLNYPDIVPSLVCSLASSKIKARLTGLKTLKIKESDRLYALKTELTKFGVTVNIGDDFLELLDYPENFNNHVVIETYNDHRIAMAFAPFGFIVDDIIIKDAEVVNKSYPSFWSDLEKIGLSYKNIQKT